MTTEQVQTPPQVTADAELAAAFEAANLQQQDNGSEKQVPGGEGSPQGESRSEDGTTTDSRSDEEKAREAVLSSLTLEDLLGHPTLGKVVKSHADKEAAAQIRGTTKQIEDRVRSQVEDEVAIRHFKSLSKEDLADELANSEDATRLYARTVGAPPPPPPNPEGAATIQYFARMIRTYSDKLTTLPSDIKTTLDPELWLKKPDVPGETLLDDWTSAVDKAIIAEQVKAATSSTKTEEESKQLNQTAKELENTKEPLAQNGRQGVPIPDVMKSTGDSLLADAFARTDRMGRK